MAIIDEVREWLDNYDEADVPGALEQLQQYGCISGMVTSLIYHDDTYDFFDRNIEEIDTIMVEMQENQAEGDPCFLQKLKGFDPYDPLFQRNNKNLVAWLAFEEVAYKLYNEEYSEYS